ncbi:chemotaxis protein CheW [Herbaspirillum sp. WKF16]|jgi:chemotaxis-related protein WspD|uniref:chemotaxis protein CheW n=1 Tax=Herbaspirillum sp. WKF16 TaxID=3028312 RepID=UPI0023A9245F|nr:chemotaxis protein CheW [Herbaspirillum sp. WKF16]WDZ94620.1 chemotaxis protein CheW [Herbaspirillum sp. WKF16]
MADIKRSGSDAAGYVLDRVSTSEALAREWADSPSLAAHETQARDFGYSESALVFRIGEEWLALATTVVNEVADARAVHSLPHQRNQAVLGVLNIRGALRICVSLARLFQVGGASAKATGQHLLVAMHEGQILVFPVDEVAGVHRYDAQDVGAAPTTLAHAATQYTQGLLDWRGRKIGLLDHGLLFYALNRSMT